MACSTIKQLNDCKQLPFLKLKDLEEEKKYEMENMGVITTKFGECVLVKLKEFENQLILPKRFQKLIPNIEKINKELLTKKIFMLLDNSNPNYLNLKFEEYLNL